MYICICNAVTDHRIREAVDSGADTFEALQDELHVATCCEAANVKYGRFPPNKRQKHTVHPACIWSVQNRPRQLNEYGISASL